MSDPIDREALMRKFTTFVKAHGDSESAPTWNDAVSLVGSMPPAQPEQKSGEWIYDGVKRICPFCKDFIVTGRSIVKYCWNCGARLKERSEDDKA